MNFREFLPSWNRDFRIYIGPWERKRDFNQLKFGFMKMYSSGLENHKTARIVFSNSEKFYTPPNICMINSILRYFCLYLLIAFINNLNSVILGQGYVTRLQSIDSRDNKSTFVFWTFLDSLQGSQEWSAPYKIVRRQGIGNFFRDLKNELSSSEYSWVQLSLE